MAHRPQRARHRQEFAVDAEPEQWQDVLVRLTPRNYSISSSPLVSPHEVQLDGLGGALPRPDGGAARRRVLDVPGGPDGRGADLPAAFATFPPARGRGNTDDHGRARHRYRPVPRLPAGNAARSGHAGRNWLFFGDQHRSENFYYRDDLEDMVRDGFLNRLDLAFSRDQAEKIYVQHKMLEHGAEVWGWLDEGAHFYVCGDATRMAKDVDAALTSIIEKHGANVRRAGPRLQA